MNLQYYIKAAYAGVTTFLSGLLVAIAEAGISSQEWITITLATTLAVGGILGLQKAPPTVSTSIRPGE